MDPHGWVTYLTFGLNRQGVVEARTDLILQTIRQQRHEGRFLERAVTTARRPLSRRHCRGSLRGVR